MPQSPISARDRMRKPRSCRINPCFHETASTFGGIMTLKRRFRVLDARATMANHRGRLTTMKKTRTSAAAAALIAVAGMSYIGLSGAATPAAQAPAEVALPLTVD